MAISRIWDADEMLRVIRRAYPYEKLTKDDFLSVISYLAGDYALEHRNVYAKIWHDAKENKIGKRGKLARVIYLTNLGTIPSEEGVSVVVNSGERRGSVVGRIDEAFLEKLKRGDIFVLGGQKYQFIHSMGMKAFVHAGITKNPTIPSWFSEMLPLNFELARGIGRFRKLVKERLGKREECIGFIREFLYCKEYVAEEIYDYIKQQKEFSEVPDEKTIVVEKFKEEKEYLLFHSLYGRRVNDALARAYGFAAGRVKTRDVEIGVNDNGFFIAGESLDENKILNWVRAKDLRAILKEAIEKTEVLRRRFRHCAGRSLMILRNYKGREKSVGRQQVHSELLFSAVKKLSDDFPILREARREVMEDLMNVHDAERVLEWIESGEVKIKLVRTPLVSPFGLNLMLQGRSDLIKMEDRASFLKRMHELHTKIIGERNG
jgi:ATP-dependent Lhr-like helicase